MFHVFNKAPERQRKGEQNQLKNLTKLLRSVNGISFFLTLPG